MRAFDSSRFRIRPATPRDHSAASQLLTRIYADHPTSAEELGEFARRSQVHPLVYRELVVVDSALGRLVGFGRLNSATDSAEPGRFFAHVAIDPDEEGNGLGRELAAGLEREALELGAVSVLALVRSDRERDVRFLREQGYEERSRYWESEISLGPSEESAPVVRAPPSLAGGVTITTLAAEGLSRGEVADRLFALAGEVIEDIPRADRIVRPTFDQFSAAYLSPPGLLPEACFLAVMGDEYVGLCLLERFPTEPGVLYQSLTGTSRRFRRRGIALYLKTRAIEYGRRNGFQSIRTFNNSLNAPMWTLNSRLGYRRHQEFLEGEKAVRPSGARPSPAR